MGKTAKYDRQIEENYTSYQAHLDARKTIAKALDVSAIKKNQANFYSGSSAVTATPPFGNTSAECKIKRNDEYHYTISYQSDAIKSRILTRLDAGAGTHFNRAPNIPLELTSVQMPHYHQYREDGYDVATPIPGVDYEDESSTKFGYGQGFSYFCDKLNISGVSGESPQITYAPPGVLPLEIQSETDPNNNVDFPE